MKAVLIALTLSVCLLAQKAADTPPKPQTPPAPVASARESPPPVLTAVDREALHEAHEALQADQIQMALGEAAAARLPERKKAVDAAVEALKTKCGPYGFEEGKDGRINCGKVKVAVAPPK